MRVLTTGGAGFIGSHVADALIGLGHEVTAVDNLSLGRRENVAQLASHPAFRLHVLDVLDHTAFDGLLRREKFDAVFHLAANSDIARSHDDPDVDFDNTLRTTYVVLQAMRRHGIRQLAFASTSAVYGDSPRELDENYGPLLPVSHYGAAKLASEALISSFSANYGIQAWIARFPNVVGERATHGAIYDFIRNLRADPSRLAVLGDGEQTKPYLYVRDLVDALIFIWQHAREPVNLFNIGASSRTNVKHMVRIVTEEMGLQPEVVFGCGQRGWVGDVPQVSYRLDKLHALGWRARRTSDEAVRTAVRAILETAA